MLYRILLLLLCGFAAAHAETFQYPEDTSEIAFRQALKDMSNDLRLMCVAAHPDDEDGATLAYHRYKYGIKTYALIGTRGEGGQNEIGPELYEDLAVIRTKEMMEAAKIEGAELHFLDMPDFGFSKTIEETFEKWGKEVLLEKMVRKIREIRPHVIITHHGRMKDHGHHQAIGWAVQEAFDKAADVNAFPDAGEPWQVQRLYIRDFSGKSNTAAVINISEKDELRGKTYAEIAADALRAHKSQGMEFFIQRLLSGDVKAYYDLVKEAERKKLSTSLGGEFGLLFEGLNVWNYFLDEKFKGISDRPTLARKLWESIDEAGHHGRHDQAARLSDPLLTITEISTSLKIADPVVVPNQSVDLHFQYDDAGELEGDSLEVSLTYPFVGPLRLVNYAEVRDSIPFMNPVRFELTGGNQAIEISVALNIPTLPFTVPNSRHVFETSKPQVCAYVHQTTGGSTSGYHVFAGISTPFEVAPPILPVFLEAPYLVRTARLRPVVVPVRLTNYTPGAHAQEVRFSAPEGWGLALHGPDGPDGQREASSGPSGPLSPSSPSNTLAFNAEFTEEDEQRTIELLLTPPKDVALGSYTIKTETAGLDFVPEAKVQVSDVKRQLGNEDPSILTSGALVVEYPIGLIDSYDTTFRDTLTKMGFELFSRIEEGMITADTLEIYDTIIVDMRSYLYRPDLKANNAVLLDWCKRGGTLIVNYHKTFDWSSDFAPYKLVLSNNRVTIEDAPVKHLVPDHPWFNYPNKIVPEDWEGWRQERGLYFAGQWDEAFTPLIETTDPGEVIPPGSCLIADYGEGKYFYTALVWYRQLRELHPGALKLFANMLAL